MPPSPAMRRSPGRELKAENHKRGHSLESGVLSREKDDDLALFNEVQNKEKDNFLLQSNDDLDDMFSTRLRYFSDYKLGISVPARGESSNLLNTDGDKNDYDWLLTPPDTPLFPSLDDETPQVNFAPRGRPRSQPMSISRSLTMEKNYKSSRGSASPNRLSPSPRSAHSTYQSRGRPSSAPHSSPPPTLRHATPPRRPSPPPNKPSTPARRSSTPTPRRSSTPTPHRTNTGPSSAGASSRVRGTSPVKSSRGNSPSPKVKAWQANIPGFSTEAPPNLRTSLADRPASYVRGSSPATRNGSKSGRQSMSPTASRSASSSYSHERDLFSSHSKGSIASSGDDDLDSLQSIPISTSSATRSIASYRATNHSKKPNRIASPSSAPKRSFDSALRQMDHRKAPQNMFRPLLSSVPTSTIYNGKASATNRSMVSRNSSVTTSSYSGSDLGISGAHETESEQNTEEVSSACLPESILNVQDQVFVYNKGDALNEDLRKTTHDSSQYGELDGDTSMDSKSVGIESCSRHDTSVVITAASEVEVGKGDFPDSTNLEDSVICSRCGCNFHVIDTTEQDLKLCPKCKSLEVLPVTTTPLPTTTVGEDHPGLSDMLLEFKSLDSFQHSMALPESVEARMSEPGLDHHVGTVEDDEHCDSKANLIEKFGDVFAEPLEEKGENSLVNLPEMAESNVNHEISNGSMRSQQSEDVIGTMNSTVEVPEGAGISLLLRRSSSSKGHVVQGRSVTSTNLSCDDLAYVRGSVNNLRSSTGHGSMSTSSSTDLSSSRQVEIHLHRQPSGKKSEMDSHRYDMLTKHQLSISSLSGASTNAFQSLSLTTSSHEECDEVSAVHAEKDIVEEACVESRELSSTSNNREKDITCIAEGDTGQRTDSENSSCITNIQLEDNLRALVSNFEESTSLGDSQNLGDNLSNSMNIEVSSAVPKTCTAEEESPSNPSADCVDFVVQNGSSLDTKSKMEIGSGHSNSSDSESDAGSPNLRSSIDEIEEPSFPVALNNDTGDPVEESDTSSHPHGILVIAEESTVTVEGQGDMKARSLTLDEATDTILFCSSIVHSLAYEAANIAIEKENSVPMEGSWPTVTMVGKTTADRKDPHFKTISKRTPKPRKARKQVERDQIPPPSKTEGEVNMELPTTKIVGAPNKGDSLKPPKLESKCNCTIM